jgi:hypothetical protein
MPNKKTTAKKSAKAKPRVKKSSARAKAPARKSSAKAKPRAKKSAARAKAPARRSSAKTKSHAARNFLIILLLIAIVVAAYLIFKGGGFSALGIGGGTFTITNIPPQYNGHYAFLSGGGSGWAIVGAENVDAKHATLCRISNGSVRIPVWKCYGARGEGRIERYSGSDSVGTIAVGITGKDKVVSMDEDGMLSGMELAREAIGIITFSSVSFSGGSTAVSWHNGMPLGL